MLLGQTFQGIPTFGDFLLSTCSPATGSSMRAPQAAMTPFYRNERRTVHALSGEMAYSSTQASGTDVGHGQIGTWAWVVEETPKVWREQGQCEE